MPNERRVPVADRLVQRTVNAVAEILLELWDGFQLAIDVIAAGGCASVWFSKK